MEDDLTVDEANEIADDILRGGDFIGANEPGVFERATNRVWDEIIDFFRRIFSAIFGSAGGGAGSVMAFVLLGLVLVLLAAAIVRAIRTGRVARLGDAAPGVRIVFDEEVDPTELLRELADRRTAGDWRGAVIAGFRLAVIEMIDDGIVAERAGATTGDFGRTISTVRPDLTPAYAEASNAFERAFYSDSTIDSSDNDSVALLRSRLQAVGQR